MNFFGGGQQQQGPDPVFAAKVELEMYVARYLPPTHTRASYVLLYL